ncbi:hypothetical protein JHK86_055656 [Glycine max]|nr:hypothetical protein JHK86_055656 [Glycine max]
MQYHGLNEHFPSCGLDLVELNDMLAFYEWLSSLQRLLSYLINSGVVVNDELMVNKVD